MKKTLIITVLTLALIGATVMGTTTVSAQSKEGLHDYIVQKLVERFGLNESEVQSVFDQVRDEHHAQMQTQLEERLQEAVDGGKITTEQKQLILDKHAQMQTTMESFKDMTPEERHEAMQMKHDELEQWAEENGIDLEDLMLGFGHGHRGSHMFFEK